jgi:hypothetical protein
VELNLDTCLGGYTTRSTDGTLDHLRTSKCLARRLNFLSRHGEGRPAPQWLPEGQRSGVHLSFLSFIGESLQAPDLAARVIYIWCYIFHHCKCAMRDLLPD